MIYKKFFITLVAAIMFVTSTCAAAKIEVIDLTSAKISTKAAPFKPSSIFSDRLI